MSEDAGMDGGHTQSYTVRLELADEPGELLNALEPIAANGGNLLSIFHERGNLTPRGRIPVEVDVECHPDRFEVIVEALRDAGVNVVKAGEERYGEELTVVLSGDLIESDLSDTLEQLEGCASASVVDLSIAATEGITAEASARVRLATEQDEATRVLECIRGIADEKGLIVIEPQIDGGGEPR